VLAWHNKPCDGGQHETNDRKGKPHVLPAHAKETGGVNGHLDRLGAAVTERETTRVCITLKDGSTRDKIVAHPRGTGQRTLTDDEILDKYRSLSRSVISLERQSAIEKTVLNIESVTDISFVVDLLTPTVRAALA
jgi:hypothetical protein